MADVSTTKVSNTTYRAQVKLNEEEFNTLFQIAQDKVKSLVRLPGFRKGKVPNYLLLQKFKPEIMAEMDILSVDFAVHEIERKTQQRIFEVEKVEELNLDNKNRSLTLVYHVFPYVKLAKLKKGYLKDYEPVSLEDDIQAYSRHKLSKFAQYQEKHIGDPITEDDVITVEFETLIDGVPMAEAKEAKVDLKNFLVEEFQLLKEKLMQDPKLANQEIVIDLPAQEKEKRQIIFTVKQIQKKIMPELTDEFVQANFGEFGLQTVSDLNNFFSDAVKKSFTMVAQEFAVQEAIKRLMEESEFFIPESAIDREIFHLLSRIGKNKVTTDEFNKIKSGLKNTIQKQISQSLTVQALLQLAKEKNFLSEEILLQKLNFLPNSKEKLKKDSSSMILGFVDGFYDEKYPAFFVYFPEDLKKVIFSILYEFLSHEAGVKKAEKKTFKEMVELMRDFSY